MSLKIVYDNNEYNIGEQLTPAVVDEDTEILVDKIASYLEQKNHWHKLKSSWLISGRSEDLRYLLRKALEDKF